MDGLTLAELKQKYELTRRKWYSMATMGNDEIASFPQWMKEQRLKRMDIMAKTGEKLAKQIAEIEGKNNTPQESQP